MIPTDQQNLATVLHAQDRRDNTPDTTNNIVNETECLLNVQCDWAALHVSSRGYKLHRQLLSYCRHSRTKAHCNAPLGNIINSRQSQHVFSWTSFIDAAYSSIGTLEPQ